MYENSAHCRSCGGTDRVEVLSFGDMPLADGLLTSEQLAQPEHRFPLTLLFCKDCSLVQIRETVSPEILFGGDYPYFSSFSEGWLQHCRENALELIDLRQLDESSLVVELASNDGYLLRNFLERQVPVLGIDPAAGPAAAAREAGVDVVEDYFTKELAERLSSEGRRADVVIANNVLAHVADLTGFVEGIRILLKEHGVAVIEVPYVRDLIEHQEFDTIYHEHLCYFSVTALSKLFASRGLHLNHVRRLPTHGGSLRLYVEKHEAASEGLLRLLQEEKQLKLDDAEHYRDFAARVRVVQKELAELVQFLRRDGKTLAAYAAAAKGATLLNSAGIGTDLLDYVVDRNRHKHDKFMPGVHLPIYDTSRLLEEMPDYVLLLAWNHKQEIFEQQAEYLQRGGRFIVPIPWPEVVTADAIEHAGVGI